MSEKGILRTDQAGGECIATRDAIELDGNSNARLIQRIDFSCTPYPLPLGTPNRATVTSADPLVLSSVPADHLANLITCGENSKLHVMVHFNGTPTTDWSYVDILPAWYDNEVTPGFLGWSEYQSVTARTGASDYIQYGTYVPTYTLTWDLVGAPRVGILVSDFDLYGCTDVDVYATVSAGNID